MASLHVRQLEPEIVEALKERARRNHRSAEAEHRAILKEVLLPSSIAKQLLKIPQDPLEAHHDVFERVQDDEVKDVFS